MKKYILVALLFFIPLLALSADITIDERKSDIYFANGVLTTEKDADKNLELIRETVRFEQYNDSSIEMEKEVNFDKAYNQTFGFAGDFYESWLQLADEDMGWGSLRAVIKIATAYVGGAGGTAVKLAEKILSLTGTVAEQTAKMAREADLSLQISKYRESIRAGHGVIVVAHSQGNLFTNEAYKKFTIDESLDGQAYRKNGWLNKYFTRISIASPSSIKEGGDVHISFHNDPIAQLSSLKQVKNPNTAYLKNVLGDITDNDALSADFHAFTYYMGEKCAQGTGQVGSGYHAKLSTDVAKIVIMKFLKDEIQTHQTKASQWETRPELESDKGTKEYKIIVEHRHDDAILTSHMQDEEVFPFAPYEESKKLYQVVDNTSEAKSDTPYVLASSDGLEILETWDGQDVDNQFYKLKGTDPVEYITGDMCQDPSLFEVITQENKNTIDWRVTVKNKETDEITEGVYPFNLEGSLYEVGGEWVLASCGATEIVNIWDEQKSYEFFMLDNPEEEKVSIRFERDDETDIVTDHKTGLQWQDESSTWLDSWYGAGRHCTALSLGEYDDWRVPTYSELIQLINLDGPTYTYEIFEHLGLVGYWSFDTVGTFPDTEEAKVVSFKNATWIYINTSQQMNTRCVRTK